MVLDATGAAFELLAWDTQHYGRTVARMRERSLDAGSLARGLAEARAQGVWLMYWLAEHDCPVGGQLLQDFGGLRVMGHVRYVRSLDRDAPQPATAQPADNEVGEFRETDDADAAVRLGVAAGALSRFRADPRLPADKCDQLYEIWTRRSLRHELADVVLVARRGSFLAGLLTVSLRGSSAAIGLVSTDPTQRGSGVGSQLIAASHAWATARGAERIEVVTQRENTAACRLYERCGYGAQERGDYYHFLL